MHLGRVVPVYEAVSKISTRVLRAVEGPLASIRGTGPERLTYNGAAEVLPQMWVALRAIGLQNAGAWAVAAGFLHIMPYFGPLLITCATALVAFMQFESLRMVLLVTGASLGIAALIGTVVTTFMTGRIARMNPAAVFVSLLFWGWLWGVWGMLLGVPVIVIWKGPPAAPGER